MIEQTEGDDAHLKKPPVDFEVQDAVDKLIRFGLVRVVEDGEDGTRLLEAVGIEAGRTALQQFLQDSLKAGESSGAAVAAHKAKRKKKKAKAWAFKEQ